MTETRPPDLAALPLWSSPAVDLTVTPPRRAWPAPRPAADPADLFSGPRQTPGRRPTPRVAHQDPGVDWALVASLRQAAAKELSAVLDAGIDPEAERAMGDDVVTALLRQLADTEASAGVISRDRVARDHLHKAVMDSLFGLGRLQPLVDDPDVENIELYGSRRTVLCYADGRVEPGPPVADSDAELTEMIAWIASRQRGGQRSFSPRTHGCTCAWTAAPGWRPSAGWPRSRSR